MLNNQPSQLLGSPISSNTSKISKGKIHLPVKWQVCTVLGRRPETREGATLTKVAVKRSVTGVEERVYLFGGLSRDLLSSLSYYIYSPTGTLLHKCADDEDDRRKRYGHAACCWENMLLVVGGSKHYNKETKRRDCLNDVMVFNPSDSHWTELEHTGISFEGRRYHSACMVGKSLIVYGGMNGGDQYLSDLLELNLDVNEANLTFTASLVNSMKPNSAKDWRDRTYRWSKINVKAGEPRPGKLAMHTTQFVLDPVRLYENGSISLYSMTAEYKNLHVRVSF